MSQFLGNVHEIQAEPENAYVSRDDGSTPVATGAKFISELAGVSVGVWEADVGHIGGETTDEIFVVLEGRAEITFEDTKETVVAGPGDVVRLHAGQRNSWKTLERLRKVSIYVPPES